MFVDPYTGAVREPEWTGAHDVLHMLEERHRWLGMDGEGQKVGKLIAGVANLAFLLMCITGVHLWWLRKWAVVEKVLRAHTRCGSIAGG